MLKIASINFLPFKRSNPIKEIQKITNTRYFLLTRPKTHKITKNREPNLLPSHFHLQFNKRNSKNYKYTIFSPPKSPHNRESHYRSPLFNRIEGKRREFKNSKIGRCHRKCSISKFHLPPLRTTRRRKSRVGREQPFPVGLSYSVGITNRISRARDTRLPRSSSTRDT